MDAKTSRRKPEFDRPAGRTGTWSCCGVVYRIIERGSTGTQRGKRQKAESRRPATHRLPPQGAPQKALLPSARLPSRQPSAPSHSRTPVASSTPESRCSLPSLSYYTPLLRAVYDKRPSLCPSKTLRPSVSRLPPPFLSVARHGIVRLAFYCLPSANPGILGSPHSLLGGLETADGVIDHLTRSGRSAECA